MHDLEATVRCAQQWHVYNPHTFFWINNVGLSQCGADGITGIHRECAFGKKMEWYRL